MSTSLTVRARVRGASEPPYDRLRDPITEALLANGDFARERFATRWSDTAALEGLGVAKRRALDPALARALRGLHERLGASAASIQALDRLAAGEVVCAIAGQQPAPLGGPLYSLHKTASAIALARAYAERTGIPCVPVYWMHGEDSDFDEIKSATLFDHDLTLHDLAMEPRWHTAGGLVGSIPIAALDPVEDAARRAWSSLPHAAEVDALLRNARERGSDLGEAHAALMLELFGEAGLVVVDPRLPEFRAAARPILERYAANADQVAVAARAAGTMLEERFGRRPLSDAALDSFLFEIRDGARTKVDPAAARDPSRTFSPNVALRPAVQDGVLPTVAMACGAGEMAYLAQLREVFEAVEVKPAAAVPRLGVTWLPRPAVELLDASGVDPWPLIMAADAAVRAMAERAVPADVRSALADARKAANEGLARFGEQARSVDASLPQMVESARGKIDFQLARLEEGVSGKVRHALERKHPTWGRVRYALLPGEKLQERRLASLQPFVHRGRAVSGEVIALALEHARGVERGEHEHWVVEL